MINKEQRLALISRFVLFGVIVGLKYLYKLQYQKGYAAGLENKNNLVDNINTVDTESRAQAFAEALSMQEVV